MPPSDKLYHWRVETVDYLVMHESVDAARISVFEYIASLRHQRPETFDRHMEVIRSAEPFAGNRGDVVLPRF